MPSIRWTMTACQVCEASYRHSTGNGYATGHLQLTIDCGVAVDGVLTGSNGGSFSRDVSRASYRDGQPASDGLSDVTCYVLGYIAWYDDVEVSTV